MTNNEFFRIECITNELVNYLMADERIDMETAMKKLSVSNTYRNLIDTNTGLFIQDAPQVYKYLQEEWASQWKKIPPLLNMWRLPKQPN